MMAHARVHERFSLSVRKMHFRVVTPGRRRAPFRRPDGSASGRAIDPTCHSEPTPFRLPLCCRFRFRVESPLTASLPECERVADIPISRTPDQLKKRAVDGRAIVVSEFDQAGLLDEAAQLDQMAGAFAPLHDPAPRISPTPCRFQTLD